jgi:hypothetical protein
MLSVLLTVVVPLLCLLSRIPSFHKAYTEHQQRLEDDAWLRAQCADPLFFTKMRQHTNVCEQVRAAFRRPPFMVGLQAACVPTAEWGGTLRALLLPSSLGWEGVVVIALCLALGPGLIVPWWRARKDLLEHERLLEACSPLLPITWQHQHQQSPHDGAAPRRRIICSAAGPMTADVFKRFGNQ